MPILFGTLAALVLAVSAWMTYKNDTEYKKQIKLTAKELKTNNELKDDFKAAQELLLKTTKEKEGLIADNKNLNKNLTTLNKEIAAVKTEIEGKKKKKLDLEQEVKEGTEILAPLGEIETLVADITKTQNDINALKEEIATMTAKKNNLIQLKSDTAKVIVVQKAEQDKVAEGKSLVRLNTSIKTVYSNWGFVTLNGGDIQGVVSGSTLDVVRDGEVIAKLKVTTVEPNRAAADILRETVSEDVVIQSGDKVVAEALPEVKSDKKAPAPAAEAKN